MQAGVEHHLARCRIVPVHQGVGVVEQDLLGHAAESLESSLNSLKPILLRLTPDARTCSRREWPKVATKRCTRTGTPAIVTRRSPKSICSCCPGGVSKRTVARTAARSVCRYGAQARSTVRRLTTSPCSAANSCRTTSALPPCRTSRSSS